jgi:hypothetical protein
MVEAKVKIVVAWIMTSGLEGCYQQFSEFCCLWFPEEKDTFTASCAVS